MPKKRRYLDDNPPQDTIKKDPAYKSLSERIMYRFWDGSPRDTYKAIDESKYLQSEPFVIDEFLGGTPQRTYFMNRNKQRQAMLYNGYQEGTPGDYGLVQKAVGKRNLPVYQTAPDEANRDNLVPIANIDNVWYGDARSSLRHPGSFPSTLYVDGRTGNTFYQKAWDLNDYGPKNGGNTIRNSNWFAKARATVADAVGSPIVQTTGYQQVSDRDIDKAYANYLADHGLHIEDGLISLPEVHVRARRLKDGGRITDKPKGGFIRNLIKSRRGKTYDDRAKASEKAMFVAWNSEYNSHYGDYNSRLARAGAMQNSFLLSGDDKDRYMLSHGYIKGTPGDYGLVRNAVGNRNLPIYQTSTDDIDREYLVPIGNNMINPDFDEESWRADRNAELKHPGSYPIAIYIDGRNPNNLYEKAWDLNDYSSSILNSVGYPAVQTTGFKRIPANRYNDLGYSHGPDYKEMRNEYLNSHGLEWNYDINQPTLPVVNVRAKRTLAAGGRIYIKPENRGKFTALKERTGHSASWFKENGTPAQKKMAVFALNSRKWKH